MHTGSEKPKLSLAKFARKNCYGMAGKETEPAVAAIRYAPALNRSPPKAATQACRTEKKKADHPGEKPDDQLYFEGGVMLSPRK